MPTEAEWEFAARGGTGQQRFPWGDELAPGGRHHANVWRESFPAQNSCDDGCNGTAPVDAYDPNGFGLFNVVGNIWEWTSDWFGVDHDPAHATNPAGAAHGTHRVMRGGSYLCHDSYCAGVVSGDGPAGS